MGKVKVHPTSTASWQALVLEAQSASHIDLPEDLQSYLVFLLMRFTDDVSVNNKPIAIDFLESLHQHGKVQQSNLRDVGDKCLLLSGFFPEQAERRLVKVSYFVDVGKSAYHVLSDLSQNTIGRLYYDLSHGFISLMDILQTMREMSCDTPLLQPIHAAELWMDTQSDHALKTLQDITDATPVKGNDSDNLF